MQARCTSGYEMVETTLRARANLEKRIRELLSLHFSAGSPINKFLLAASLQRLPAFLFGGTLRDLLVFGSLPRDLDIVVRTSNLETFAGDFERYLVRRTRFGGMHFVVAAE